MKTRIIDSVTPPAAPVQSTFPALYRRECGAIAFASDPTDGVVIVGSDEIALGFTWFNSVAPWGATSTWKRVTEPTVVEFNAR